ncbi:HIT-like domain-containing protein [Tribonema minus]|uniref:HIT-like domain-containing protein n=1 Tax=Tribonema minus TaxID=303371 RepID=A0A835YP06_9STRA|nr:HIT-like domain-containing protein [Tribonema minus]
MACMFEKFADQSPVLLLRDFVLASCCRSQNPFARIARKEDPAEVVFEDDQFIAFWDSHKASQTHFLIVPKDGAVRDASLLNAKHVDMLEAMIAVARQLIREEARLTNNQQRTQAILGFHLPPVAKVPHLHMHCIAPRVKMGWRARLLFWPDSPWFVTADTLLRRLQEKQRAHITI